MKCMESFETHDIFEIHDIYDSVCLLLVSFCRSVPPEFLRSFLSNGPACFRVMVIKLRPYTEEVILGKSKEKVNKNSGVSSFFTFIFSDYYNIQFLLLCHKNPKHFFTSSHTVTEKSGELSLLLTKCQNQ